MHYDILDEERQCILPLLGMLKRTFYLAGGTALALQLGHRDSIDFDFFTTEHIDTKKLFETLQEALKGHVCIKVQEETDTLSIIIDEHIKLSFFTYTYPLLKDPISDKYLRIATMEDIGCMKLSAITGRASNKDYIDLYYILHIVPLHSLLNFAREKFSSLDTNLILKSLVYFDDIFYEPILFREGKEISFDTVKEFLEETVKRCN